MVSIRKSLLLLSLTMSVLFMLILPQTFSQGGSTYLESSISSGFKNGITYNTTITTQGVSLNINYSGIGNWTLINSTDTIARDQHALDYDVKTDEYILFGGTRNNVYFNDTWSFNYSNKTWTKEETSGSPSARASHSMVYDNILNRFILFGGKINADLFGDTWIFDRDNRTWTNITPPTSPQARFGHEMVLCSDENAILLFGGKSTVPINDTWTFNLTTLKWTKKTPSNSPAPRNYFGMTYDRSANEVILFGGQYWTLSPLIEYRYQDTWIYNCTQNSWQNVTPAISPSARYLHSLTNNVYENNILMFGGGNNEGDTWIFNHSSNTWSQQSPKSSPTPVRGSRMVYDPREKVILISCGFDRVNWVWKGDLLAWNLSFQTYKNKGEYCSDSQGTKELAFFGSISWVANASDNTTVQFQFRSANTENDLNVSDFLGPDGTDSSHYVESGSIINPIHNRSRWFQYKLLLTTINPMETPVIQSVQIKYNLIHKLNTVIPRGNENWTGIQKISWNASDPDNDKLYYDVILEGKQQNITLVQNISEMDWAWNTTDYQNGTYCIRIVAHDNNLSIPLSVEAVTKPFIIYHPKPNALPVVQLLSPQNNTMLNDTSIVLKWTGWDDDADPLFYYIFFDDVDGSSLVSETDATEYSMWDLVKGKTYYWTIIAYDGKDHCPCKDIWSFSIYSPPINRPPKIVGLPPNEATVGIEYLFYVNATDEDKTDILQYAIDNPPPGMSIMPSSGLISWTPTEKQLGVQRIRFNITDGKLFILYEFIITVLPAFVPPDYNITIISSPPLNAQVGVKYSYQVIIEGEYSPSEILFNLDKSPSGMTINSTGYLFWIPQQLQIGQNLIIINASNSTTYYLQDFIIIVSPIPYTHQNRNPVIISTPNALIIQVGHEFRYQVYAQDPDSNDTLSYSLSNAPSSMTINKTGLIIWKPKEQDIGTIYFNISVRDNNGGLDNQTVIIQVIRAQTNPSSSAVNWIYFISIPILVINFGIIYYIYLRKKKKRYNK